MSQLGAHHRLNQLAGAETNRSGSPSQLALAGAGASQLLVGRRMASSGSASGATGASKRGHQRRQSVARLLPDISKLRLLSWLVEASNELINCDIAIMDGIYAKLNRSRESLLLWHPPTGARLQQQPPAVRQRPARPAPPAKQPVANRLLLQQHQLLLSGSPTQQQQLLPKRRTKISDNRNHHSLPVSSTFDSDSVAALSSLASRPAGKADSLPQTGALAARPNVAAAGTSCDTSKREQLCDNSPSDDNNWPDEDADVDAGEDEDEEDEEDDRSSASSSASSGIHANSLSSSTSSSGSISASSTSSSSSSADQTNQAQQQPQQQPPRHANSAQELSEKIIRTVMEHQYLQNLLVNIIRQHDKQRNQANQQRRRQMSLDLYPGSELRGNCQKAAPQRIDLAEIADALDDGCLCNCHSSVHHQIQLDAVSIGKYGRSCTLPSTSSSQQVASVAALASPARSKTASRLKKGFRGESGASANSSRQEIINLMSDKHCENCFETHYWLHGCFLDSNATAPGTPNNKSNRSTQDSSSSLPNAQDLNNIISKRNANFIKLVQQQVRSTISKSIELIDLIRKEIKLPESIKQKQLMRCFSASIQLLTSVGNYVVPAQDISTFIPEVGQQQTTLFSLPPSDFENILYPPQVGPHQPIPSFLQVNHETSASDLHYHLAQAPEIPMRRNIKTAQFSIAGSQQQRHSSQPVSSRESAKRNDNQVVDSHGPLNVGADQVPSDTAQKLKTLDELKLASIQPGQAASASANESSSGASSNNSSASSSIARGTVQQSSLTRASETAHQSALLEKAKTSHGLSFETMGSLSGEQHQQQAIEADLFLQSSRPKFWQSSKFNFIKKLLHVRQQRLLRQQSKDRKIYNNKVQNKFRLVMMDLTHFNKSQQLLTTENGVNSLLTSMRNVLEFGLYLTLKLY